MGGGQRFSSSDFLLNAFSEANLIFVPSTTEIHFVSVTWALSQDVSLSHTYTLLFLPKPHNTRFTVKTHKQGKLALIRLYNM